MAAISSPRETKTFSRTVTEAAGRAESFFSASIYRVPRQLRKLNESAYTPCLVSIGPFHKDLESPQARDLKMWYVNSFVGRKAVGLQDSNSIAACNLDELKEEMTEDLNRAKKHYAEEVGNKLTAEMLVVDGCFILEVLCRYKIKCDREISIEQPTRRGEEISNEQPTPSCLPHLVHSLFHLVGCSPQPTEHLSISLGEEMKSSEQPTDDPIFDSPLICSTVEIDLLLLENQIPFFVLEKLFSRTKNLPPSVLIADYIIPYFHDVMVPDRSKSADTRGRMDGKKKEPESTEETKKVNDHILQILHDHNLPPQGKVRKGNCEEFESSALELEYSGVKFLAGSEQDLSKIYFYKEEGRFSWFCQAKFTIPRFSIDDTTEPVLRNLIAFEQCHPNTSRYFTSFAFLMDMLVSSEQDVEVLEKAHVIRENLGSKKNVCDLLSNITKEIVLEDFFFAKTCERARDYRHGEWSKFMAQLRRTWFASPWTFIAFCVVGLAFGISITQFIRSFFKPTWMRS